MRGFVLVGGWPGSGKTTLSRALAASLGVDYLSKDDAKEALMDALGTPATVEESRRLGRAAVTVTLRLARGCRAAVIDSTWYPYAAPLVAALAGPLVELRCVLPVEVARSRYRARSRDRRHLDAVRTDAELWGDVVAPLGVGTLIEVDTEHPVQLARLTRRVREALGG